MLNNVAIAPCQTLPFDKKMILLISLVFSLAVFGFWMNIVGNPHVVETVIGLVIAITVGVLVNRSLKKTFNKEKS